MNDEKLDLLIERINQLEAKVSQMNAPVVIQTRMETTEHDMSDKLKSRQVLLETIQNQYPGLMVTIAKRQDGGGLLLINKKNNNTYRMKCYYSKNHRQERLFGWFSLKTSDVIENPYDFYAMGLDFNGKHHVFIFNHTQVLDVLKKRNPHKDLKTSTELIEHMYIEAINQRFFETREIDKSLDDYRGMVEGGVDVTFAYNHYELIQDTIGDIQVASNQPFITSDPVVIKNKIHEVLKNRFLVPLYRKDFYYTGDLQQYIEMNNDDVKPNPSDLKMDNIKSVIMHIQAGYNTPLSIIHNIITDIEALFGVTVLMGLSMREQKGAVSQIFIIGNKEV